MKVPQYDGKGGAREVEVPLTVTSKPLLSAETEAIIAGVSKRTPIPASHALVLSPLALDMSPAQIAASAQRFANHYGVRDTVRFVEALLRGPLQHVPDFETFLDADDKIN